MATNFVDYFDEDIDVYWNLLHRLTIVRPSQNARGSKFTGLVMQK